MSARIQHADRGASVDDNVKSTEAIVCSHNAEVCSFSPQEINDLFQKALNLHRQSLFHQAAEIYRKILAADPDHAGALHFLGMYYFTIGNIDDSLLLIEQSLKYSPEDVVFLNNYGLVLKQSGKKELARQVFEKVISIDVTFADAYSNLGIVSIELGLPCEVTESYFRTAIDIQPNHVDAIRNLGAFYVQHELFDDALLMARQLETLQSPNATLYHHLGCLHGDTGDIEQAQKYFEQAAILPAGRKAWKWKHLAYSPVFFANQIQIDAYWHQLSTDLDAAISEHNLYHWESLPYEGYTHSFHLPHHDKCCREVLEKFASIFSGSFPFERPKYLPGKKIRVGFLVTPNNEGGFIRLTTGIIDNLDSDKFEVIVIYSESKRDVFSNAYKRTDITHVVYGSNFAEAVYAIKAVKCDVIYYWKVAADTWSFFLPMCYLAPIQCTSWSTHGTSGVRHIDYYVSWDMAEIPDAQKHYTEKLFLLKTTPLYEPILETISPPVSRQMLDLPEDGAIYFCPHRPSKYHPEFDDYLKQILERDTTGHIVIFMGKQMSLAAKFAKRIFDHVGENLFSRIIILPQQALQQYYKYLSVSTVLLNSPVYSGEITAIDGFLYGVPSVTLTGELLVERYSTAFYEMFGIDGPAAPNKERYISEAV
ncbi:MAG: tetratricopeptide repeat protein, partial [Thermoguttaceae bacterium]